MGLFDKLKDALFEEVEEEEVIEEKPIEPKKEVVTKTVERESKVQTVSNQTNVSQEDYDSLMSEIQKMLKGEN